MRTFKILTAVAFLAAASQPAFAGATLQGAATGATASTGAGFAAIAPGADLAPGTRVRIQTAKAGQSGEAALKFSDGCEIALSSGQVFTIGESSPCAFNGQASDPGGFGGLSTPALLGLALGLGGIAAAIALAVSDRGGSDNSQRLAYLRLLLSR